MNMGGLLPGYRGRESRRRLLVPIYRPLRRCPDLTLLRHPARPGCGRRKRRRSGPTEIRSKRLMVGVEQREVSGLVFRTVYSQVAACVNDLPGNTCFPVSCSGGRACFGVLVRNVSPAAIHEVVLPRWR